MDGKEKMIELISKDQAIKEFYAREHDYDPEWGNLRFRTEDVEEILKSIPHVDAAPVMYGKWLGEHDGYKWYGKCSVCSHEFSIDSWYADMNYCPNCGAKMTKGE